MRLQEERHAFSSHLVFMTSFYVQSIDNSNHRRSQHGGYTLGKLSSRVRLSNCLGVSCNNFPKNGLEGTCNGQIVTRCCSKMVQALHPKCSVEAVVVIIATRWRLWSKRVPRRLDEEELADASAQYGHLCTRAGSIHSNVFDGSRKPGTYDSCSLLVSAATRLSQAVLAQNRECLALRWVKSDRRSRTDQIATSRHVVAKYQDLKA